MKLRISLWMSACAAALLGVSTVSAQEGVKPSPAPMPTPVASAPTNPYQPACCQVDCLGCVQGKDLEVAIGGRTWFSWGQSTWTVAIPGFLSDLKWRDLDSIVLEFNVDATLDGCWVGHLDIGFGKIDDGYIDDYDFAGTDRTNLAALSRTDVTADGLFYVNVDVGCRILSLGDACDPCSPRIQVDALVGFQYSREEYFSQDGTQLVTNPPLVGIGPPPGPIPGPHLREVWERKSIRVGLRGNYQHDEQCSINSRLMFVPWADHSMVDDHLSSATGASVRKYDNQSEGGFGIMWDATVSYRLSECLSAEAGYQLWYMEVNDGTTQITGPGTAPGTGSVKELSSFRHGVLVGLNYRF